ncbi:hypothetical protein EV359DRAFT_66239 [Lentinula novae-zelandiae]|nr:hypothetical protein EV359DRAFT_66239 [Lentinula novae-zelandiae]
MTTNNYGMPALSAEAKAEIDTASAKLPRKYKTAPLFDITDPSQMIPWFEATESIFEHGGITSDEAKEKMRIFRLLFDAEMKKLMDEPKMIMNSDAVRLFLAPMTPEVRRGVLETVVKDVSVTSMSDRGHINLLFAADVPKTDRNYLQALKPKVEDEFKDLLGIKLESLIPRELTEEQQQMVALNKDLMEANMKEIRAVKSLQSHFKEGADIMTQLTAKYDTEKFEWNSVGVFLVGWMMPEGGDSKRYKLRDNARMPQDNTNVPRYKKIEQMAKDLGWDRAESYFANMEDDEDDKVMDQQMNPNVNLAVWMTRIEELSDRLGNLEAHQEDDVRVFNQDSSNGKK